MNYIDPKTQYRFEKLDFDKNADVDAEANVDEKKDQEYSGGVGIRFENPMQNEKLKKGGSIQSTDTGKTNDLVVPFSLAYRATKTNKQSIRTDHKTPTVIGGDLFDAMFFKMGSESKKTKAMTPVEIDE